MEEIQYNNRNDGELEQLLQDTLNSEGDFQDTTSEISESDSDEDLEMAGIALMPGYFKGQQSEDAEAWWGDVENWCTYKKLIDREKLGHVPLLLKDGASQWFQAMPVEEKDTFEKIQAAFAAQYEYDEIYKWKDSAAVWATSQQETQSVEDYFTEVLKKAQRANL